MSDLRELYQEVILDHGKRPRNFRKMDEASHSAKGYNPLCGDKITVYLKFENGVVENITFEGAGCAISTASASMMTQIVKGKTAEQVEEMFSGFHEVVTGKAALEDVQDLGKLAVFAGVSEFPVRVKCATLPWHTLTAAMKKEAETVSTE